MFARTLLALSLLLLLTACNAQPRTAALVCATAVPVTAATTPDHDMGDMPMADMPMGNDHPDDMGQSDTTEAMSNRHVHGGPHMKMTAACSPTEADTTRFQQLEQTAREKLAKYKDYKLAEREGYVPFFPDTPQEVYHFNNYGNSFAEGFRFDPAKPGSLLYKKVGDGYELVGVMYTAPENYTDAQLNERVPIGIAPWHQHVNICFPPLHLWGKDDPANPRFGVVGSIATEAECEAAGGDFYPRVFGWMTHLYPFENQ